MATLLRDPALRARMGEYGREQVEMRFTAQRMAEDTARVYQSLLSASNQRSFAARGDVLS
jgi:glycosyltransferase involved in cell wall biosynthesis